MMMDEKFESGTEKFAFISALLLALIFATLFAEVTATATAMPTYTPTTTATPTTATPTTTATARSTHFAIKCVLAGGYPVSMWGNYVCWAGMKYHPARDLGIYSQHHIPPHFEYWWGINIR